jgi:hypothetical protein
VRKLEKKQLAVFNPGQKDEYHPPGSGPQTNPFFKKGFGTQKTLPEQGN